MNFVDITVLAILGLSTLFAFARGFAKEVLSILSWVGAVLATIILLPWALPYAKTYISDEMLAKIVSGAVLFVVTLFVLGFANHFISAQVKKSAFVGPTDRALGLAFGFVRGMAIIGLAHIAMTQIFQDPKQRPEIITSAVSEPFAAKAAEYILALLPPGILEKGGIILDEGMAAVEKKGTELVVESVTGNNGNPNQSGQDGKSGYNDSERSDLEKLLQGTQGSDPQTQQTQQPQQPTQP